MNRLLKSIEKDKTDPYFVSWKPLAEEIGFLHSKKGSKAIAEMKQGIALYKSLLEQCSCEGEKIEPLNNSERLTFIEENPAAFAAFRQLQELFNEMQKKIASKRAVLNKKNF